MSDPKSDFERKLAFIHSWPNADEDGILVLTGNDTFYARELFEEKKPIEPQFKFHLIHEKPMNRKCERCGELFRNWCDPDSKSPMTLNVEICEMCHEQDFRFENSATLEVQAVRCEANFKKDSKKASCEGVQYSCSVCCKEYCEKHFKLNHKTKCKYCKAPDCCWISAGDRRFCVCSDCR